ncbi:MAG: dihydropteroate synthase, partial [Armatimonadetes bacterium]|nr:dihydropteroate synthase [Armatimonadota bacterium]
GLPKAIPLKPHYEDVVAEVKEHLRAQADLAVRAGFARENIILDPGFGFGKTVQNNLALLKRLRELVELGYPVLMGTSRKSTIGRVLGDLPPQERLEGTAATVALSIVYGASIVRVHDVKEMARVVKMSVAVINGWEEE